MAGANIKINVETSRMQRSVDRVVALLQRPAPLMSELGEHLRGSTRGRFKAQTEPDGTPWQALKPAYRRRKPRNRAKVLTLDGHLRSQITFQLQGDDAVAVGSNSKYAAIHQFGGAIEIAARSQQAYFRRNAKTHEVGRLFVKKERSNFAQRVTIGAYKITMPARPFLGLSQDDRNEIVAKTQLFIRDVLAGSR